MSDLNFLGEDLVAAFADFKAQLEAQSNLVESFRQNPIEKGLPAGVGFDFHLKVDASQFSEEVYLAELSEAVTTAVREHFEAAALAEELGFELADGSVGEEDAREYAIRLEDRPAAAKLLVRVLARLEVDAETRHDFWDEIFHWADYEEDLEGIATTERDRAEEEIKGGTPAQVEAAPAKEPGPFGRCTTCGSLLNRYDECILIDVSVADAIRRGLL